MSSEQTTKFCCGTCRLWSAAKKGSVAGTCIWSPDDAPPWYRHNEEHKTLATDGADCDVWTSTELIDADALGANNDVR